VTDRVNSSSVPLSLCRCIGTSDVTVRCQMRLVSTVSATLRVHAQRAFGCITREWLEGETDVTGTIRTLRTDKGFGFIKTEGGNEYFFHQSAIVPPDRRRASPLDPVQRPHVEDVLEQRLAFCGTGGGTCRARANRSATTSPEKKKGCSAR
jgi:hypothetical protein